MPELNDHSKRAHALLSASSAHRWLACPPSALIAEKYPQQDTDFTREGTLAHEVAEITARENIHPETGRDGFAPEVTQEMLDCAAAYRDYIQEQTKSNDAIVLLEQRVDFSPWVPDGFGTCDCIILQGDTMDVIDYKYGQGVPVDAKDNPQLRLYALGALNDYGIAFDVKKVKMHIFQPRLNNVTQDSLTAKQLLKWADKTVKPIADKAAAGTGELKAGDHCKFCPHAGKCRTLTDTCWDFAEAHGLGKDDYTMDAVEVGDVLAMAPIIDLWLKRVRDQALSTMLDGGSIPGYKVVEGRGSRTWGDELQVADTLKAAGYSLEDITETSLLSVAKMEKAIGKKRAEEIVGELIVRKPGAPTVAMETDKRPAYDRLAEAVEDFA